MIEVMAKGAFISGGLIIAIGSQNVFVLRQGLIRNNVFFVSAICFACDVILMAIGIMGLGAIVSSSSYLMSILAIAGSAFMYWYGFEAFKRAYKGDATLSPNSGVSLESTSLRKTIAATLAITLLNPHVYLDTVVIIGGIAGTLSSNEKIWFLAGSLAASFIWFFGLGYGSRYASTLFKKPVTWRVLDLGIGVVMFWIATGLLRLVLFDQ